MVAQKTREYEMIMVLSSESIEEEVDAAIEMVTGSITGLNGEVIETDNWGVRQLPFPVMKSREGNFTKVKFRMPSSDVVEFERNLNASGQILRLLITKV